MILFEGIIFFLISYILGLITLPKVKNFGVKFGLYDYIDKRKINTIPLIRIGGICIIFTFLFSLFIFKLYKLDLSIFNQPIIYAPILFSIIGLIDDISNLSTFKKLISQILISLFLYFQGINIGNLYDFSNYNIFLEYLSKFDLIFTIIWIVGLTNAINWTDGLDGLAAGISVIFSISLLIISYHQNNADLTIILFLIIGSCLAFLKSNYYPAKIIMGDSGSYFLGSFIAISSISVFSLTSNESSIFVPLLILFIPISDMGIVIFKRLINRKSPFSADKSHLHHRLIKKISSHKKTVLIIHFFSIIFSCLGLIFFFKI